MPKKQQDKQIELRNPIELEEIDEIDSDYVAYEDLEEPQGIDFQKGPSLDIKNTNNVVFSKRVERYFRSMRFELNALGLDFLLLSSKKVPKNGLLSAYHRQIDVMGDESVEDGHVLDDETALPEGRGAYNRTPLLSDMQNVIELEASEDLSAESNSVNNEVEDEIESSNNSILLDTLNVIWGNSFFKKNDASLLICADQINFAELDRILRIKPHSRFIRWLLTDNIARKALVFIFTHRWPRNIAVPTKHFRHTKAAGAFSHTDKLVKYVWDALLVSFFIQDFIDYYAYPDYRNERGLFETLFSSRGNKQLLAESLYNPYVLSILLGAPLTVGLLHSGYDYFRSNRVNPERLSKALLGSLQSSWYSRLYKDYLRWMNPFNGAKRRLDKAQETLIGDGRKYLSAIERVDLFNQLIDAIKASRGVTRLYAIWTLQYLAYGISTEDIRKQSKKYKTDKERLYFREELKAHLVIRTRALELLRQIAKNNVPHQKCHLHEQLLAEELLWEIGFSAKNPLHPAHGFALTVFSVDAYFRISLLILLIHGVQYSYDQFKQRRDCLRQGKLWMYMSQPGKMMCSVCGDFPINYKLDFG